MLIALQLLLHFVVVISSKAVQALRKADKE
jgi:hypothetical protein